MGLNTQQDSASLPDQKKSFWDRLRHRSIAVSPLAIIAVLVLSAGTVLAFRAITTDTATFNSSINSDRPIRQHLLQVDGSGDLVANLEDTTQDTVNQVNYVLRLLDSSGAILQEIEATQPGGPIQMVEVVSPGVYTFTVSTQDVLTETGAHYRLSLQYPNETDEFTDTVAPTLAVTMPARNAEVSGVVTVEGTASDETSLEQVTIRFNEGAWMVVNGTETWNISYDSNNVEDGEHIIQVRATDSSGNSVTETIPVAVSNGTSPTDPTPDPGPTPDPTPDPGPTPDPTPDPGPSPNPDTGASDDNQFTDDFVLGDWQNRYDFNIWHRDDNLVSMTSWPGDHQSTGGGDLCNSPDNKRTIQRGDRSSNFNNDWIYRCVPGGDANKAHIMTSIGDTSGYSIGAFSPKETFNGITEVRWDVNQTDLGDRQWTEVAIIPVSTYDMDNLPCATGLPCGNHTHETANSVGTQWGGQRARMIITPAMPGGYTEAGGSLGYRCSGCPYAPSQRFGGSYGVGDPALTSIQIRRENFFRDNGNGTLTWGFELYDQPGQFEELTVPGSFPSGDVRVVFKDHNYTPNKSPSTLLPETTYTWHWDDISIQ